MSRPPLAARVAAIAILCALGGVLVWSLTRPPKQPQSRRAQQAARELRELAEAERLRDDARLIRQLLEEDLGQRRFPFPVVVIAAADREVIPLDRDRPSHARVTAALGAALDEVLAELSAPGSPVRGLRRINEASRFFEDALLARLDATEGLRCEVPTNRQGERRRSGYPDLRVVDEASGEVFYLDPKLLERDSWDSSFRSFYFEPRKETLKINDHAVHLLVGIEHDGNDGAWSFTRWKLADLSTLEVRLKAEFQASNRDLYDE